MPGLSRPSRLVCWAGRKDVDARVEPDAEVDNIHAQARL